MSSRLRLVASNQMKQKTVTGSVKWNQVSSEDGTFRTIEITDGAKGVVGKLKANKEERSSSNRQFQIVERNEEFRNVTGVVADPINVDEGGLQIPEHLIEIAQFEFSLNFMNTGINHEKDDLGRPVVRNDQIVITENWRVRNDQVIDGEFVARGSWMLTFHFVDRELWEKVKRGELNGFSFESLLAARPANATA